MAKARVGCGEDLEGRLKGLKLTEEETSKVKGSWSADDRELELVPQAVGKLFSSKPGYVEGMIRTLGKIWCPTKGIRCKELGDNIFLFSFLQPGGKRRAITDGPWEFGGDLLIVVDFDSSKRLKDLQFIYTPMWIRVFDLPLGMMNTVTGKAIGDKVGKVLEIATDADGSAVGSYLRVKVQVDIRKPLIRGVTLEKDTGGGDLWCPITYEFLPNFCYECGLLGHLEKECDDSVGKEHAKQFGDWLRASPSRRRVAEGGSSGSYPVQRSSDRWGRNSGKNSPCQITNSRRDSSRCEPELHDDGVDSLKVKENGHKHNEASILLLDKDGDQKGKEKGVMEKMEGRNNENKIFGLEGDSRDSVVALNTVSMGNMKEIGSVMDRAIQVGNVSEEMEMESNFAMAEIPVPTQIDQQSSVFSGRTSSGPAVGDVNQDIFMKAKKGRERKGLKTFRRFPQSSICADGTPNKQENKKRYLEEREEDGDVQKKMRRESLNLHEVDMDDVFSTAGLHEQLRQDQ